MWFWYFEIKIFQSSGCGNIVNIVCYNMYHVKKYLNSFLVVEWLI